jgi:hypothetical protein
MKQNPYTAPTSPAQSERDGDVRTTEKRLDVLSRITIGACVLWFGMMIVGRFLDENAPPIRSMFGFYAIIGIAPTLGLYGALSTLKRKRYAMSVLGSVCISIPLIGPWCGLTIPIGVWSLILLRRPEIKVSFTSSLDFNSHDRDSADDVLAHAAHLDRAGEWDEAIAAYRDAAERWPEHTQYINNCIAGIISKQSAAS